MHLEDAFLKCSVVSRRIGTSNVQKFDAQFVDAHRHQADAVRRIYAIKSHPDMFEAIELLINERLAQLFIDYVADMSSSVSSDGSDLMLKS